MATSQTAMATDVAFVVAGPGDPELLTVRAHRLLKSADLVLADIEAVRMAELVSSAKC